MKVRRETKKVDTGNSFERQKRSPKCIDILKLKDIHVAFVSLLIVAAQEKSKCTVKKSFLVPSFLQTACGRLKGDGAVLYFYNKMFCPVVSRQAEGGAPLSSASHQPTHMRSVVSTQCTQELDKHWGPRGRKRGEGWLSAAFFMSLLFFLIILYCQKANDKVNF